MTETTSSNQPRWRYTRAGSILTSWDFLVGVPIGLGTAVAVGFSDEIQDAAPGLLIGTAAVSAAIATLVLTSLTVLLTTVSAEYRSYLRQLPEGVTGMTVPYRLIVKIGSIGALCSLVAAFAVSVPGGLSIGNFHAGVAFAVAPGLALTAWATLGCIQVTEQFIDHWEKNDKIVAIEERRRRALARTAS